MTTATILRAVRQPLTWLIVVAFALLALLALESTGSKHAPSVVPLSIVANQSGQSNGNQTKHCSDSSNPQNKGKDDQKNKHCRQGSAH